MSAAPPELHAMGVAELVHAMARGQTSSVEVTTHLLARVAEHEQLGAFLHVSRDSALQAARAADAKRAATSKAVSTNGLLGNRDFLLGVPLAHKDIFVTADMPTTAGSKMLQGYQSPFDATVVTRLAQAGAVSLGKLNCDEFAMGSANENSAYGPVANPWDVTRVPGGSSGGSAAAVAARLLPAATGTDTGGSIRQPASFCGITGIKPTYGVCSRFGMVAFASSLDQAGPMARSAEDCAMLLTAMAGFDERDATSAQQAPRDFHALMQAPRAGASAAKPLTGLRVGLPREFFPQALAQDVHQTLRNALRELEALGATLVDVSLPRTELAIPVYYIIAPAEASSNLSRFDGVRYGHRAAQYDDLLDMHRKSRAEGFGPEVKRRIMIGTYVLSHGYYDAYYLQAQKLRRMIVDDFQAAFQHCDVIAGPAAPSVAWKLGDKSADPTAAYLADIFTLPASLAGLPGMSLPAGFGEGGMPVGLQLIGNYFDEGALLHTAHALQQATDWHRQSPDLHRQSPSLHPRDIGLKTST
jgi:aspartyl-tRNA(Asn)/glutamyl-tRNA(Gln) amidotransferase subunit A